MNRNKLIRIITVILIVINVFVFVLPSHAAHDLHWFLKRRPGSAPLFPDEADEIEKYSAYYIDKTADENRKVIYITFDAGYENGNIEKILDILKDESVPAAFFLLDNIILKNTELVKRMAEEGHLVCNHTKCHRNLSRASEEEIKEDLLALESIYKEQTGKEMAKYFRFPEGTYSIKALKSIQSLGYKTVFWSFAYDDWDNHRQLHPKKAIKKILDNTHNGAVMLFHPTSDTNAEIFRDLIKAWREMGYSFGTLDELTQFN